MMRVPAGAWRGAAALVVSALATAAIGTPSRAGLAAVGVNDTLSMHHDRVASVPAPGVLGNDLNLLGSTTAVLVSTTSHGVLSLHADGGYTYAPSAAYVGTDTFRYRPSGLLSTAATVTITITNAIPVVSADSYSVRSGATLSVAAPGVLGNDTDADGDSLTVQAVSGVSHGTLVLSSNGALTYAPVSGYVGSDGFTYRAWDGVAWSAAAQVSMTVLSPLATPTPSPTITPSSSTSPSALPSAPGGSATPAPSIGLPVPSIPLPSLPLPTFAVPSLPPGASTSGLPIPSAGADPSQPSPSPSAGPSDGAVTIGPPSAPGDPGGGGGSVGGTGSAGRDAPTVGGSGLAIPIGNGSGLQLANLGALTSSPLWLVPAAAVAGPGLLVLLWLAIQVAAGAAWLPATRRLRGEERRRRRMRRLA